MINRFRKYLDFLDEELEVMFNNQKSFIKCKKGCAFCCKEGEYPLSELEYVNLMFYYNNKVCPDVQNLINKNITNLIENSKTKMYKCPFLIDNLCTVYPARGIICRTFGLLSHDKKGKKRIPFCVDLGLNYSEVYDSEKGIITKNADDGSEPLAFNIERAVLRSSKAESEFGIFFGEDRSMIDWLREDWNSSENTL